MVCVLAVGLSHAIAAQEAPSPSPSPVGYTAALAQGVAMLDRGQHRAAHTQFTRAGERAPDAPVWRVCAGVALLGAGDVEGANAMFRAALALGYPPSDLVALEPRTEALAALHRETDADARAEWVSVTVGLEGLPPVPADVRHARFKPAVTTKLSGLTHVVGVPLASFSSALHFFRVDPASGRIELLVPQDGELARRAHGASQTGYASLAWVDDATPWPRGKPFVRALHTGLLLDVPAARYEHELLHLIAVDVAGGVGQICAQTWYGPESARRVDLQRMQLSVPSAGLDPRAGDIEEVTALPTLGRVKALLGREARVWRMHGGLPEVDGCLLVAPNFLHPDEKRRAWPALMVFDREGERVVAELDFTATEAEARGTDASFSCGRPAYSRSRARLVVSTNAAGGTLETFDTANWSLAWRIPAAKGRERAREVVIAEGLVFASLPDLAHTEIWRLADGTPVATQRGFVRIVPSSDGSCIVAEGLAGLHVIDTRAFAADPSSALESPRMTLWLATEGKRREREALVVVASDGTWLMPPSAVAHARLLLGDVLVPADSLAPWLFDPLHVRTALQDADPSPRRFPRPR